MHTLERRLIGKQSSLALAFLVLFVLHNMVSTSMHRYVWQRSVSAARFATFTPRPLDYALYIPRNQFPRSGE
jgi:hypothetical protein